MICFDGEITEAVLVGTKLHLVHYFHIIRKYIHVDILYLSVSNMSICNKIQNIFHNDSIKLIINKNTINEYN